MPYFHSSQEWLEQSVLLVEARPSTTRITTRYSIKAVKPFVEKKAAGDQDVTPTTRPPRARLVLKTFDPVSGVTLKYRTTKAAEVSRLVHASLGTVARAMAALPATAADSVQEESVLDAQPAAPDAPTATTSREAKAVQGLSSRQQPQQQTAGAGHKKKKGRK
ncbi:hypothetical protein XA68_16229 [Ophiocordyceps unilateralis]|uniref:SRP9 domain-containing protein n=1 Tax=Ophiocordyceps unilateralis TaxID=268505 RepID=A0A2A9PL85_OPHUN|nr:hypothetical protein XA68_16229 [Ophiocordyceps unilateralis]